MDKDKLEDQTNNITKMMREVSKNYQVSVEKLANAFTKLNNSGLKSLTEVAKINQPWYTKLRKFFWNV